jgi:hypothetical protein
MWRQRDQSISSFAGHIFRSLSSRIIDKFRPTKIYVFPTDFNVSLCCTCLILSPCNVRFAFPDVCICSRLHFFDTDSNFVILDVLSIVIFH